MSRRTSFVSKGPRWEEIIRSSRPPRPRRGSGMRRKGLFYGLMLLLVVSVLGASVFSYFQLKFRGSVIDIPGLSLQAPKEPMNVLILGSDARDVLPEEEQGRFDPTGKDRQTGRRADTIMLVHLDEQRDQAVLIHFPRDLRVTHSDESVGKINGVYQKGPDAMVQTVEQFSGLPIHHYIEVNFVGFRNVVNALGGVEVHFDEPISEPDSGLNVPSGCVELKGDQALAFVRVRKIDDDFGRIARQQLFVSLMMDKVTSAGTLLNPFKLFKLIDLGAENVTFDERISIWDIRKLAWRLRSFDPKKVDMRVVPSAAARIRGVSYVIANERQTEALFTAVRERQPLPDYGRTGVSSIDPTEVRLTVFNGTTVRGLGAKAVEELKGKGYQVAEPALNADSSSYDKTVVFYKEGNDEKARLVAGPYAADVKVAPDRLVFENEVAIVLGNDYAEGAVPPPPPAEGESPAGEEPKPPIRRCDA